MSILGRVLSPWQFLFDLADEVATGLQMATDILWPADQAAANRAHAAAEAFGPKCDCGLTDDLDDLDKHSATCSAWYDGADQLADAEAEEEVWDGRCPKCGKGIGHFLTCIDHPDFVPDWWDDRERRCVQCGAERFLLSDGGRCDGCEAVFYPESTDLDEIAELLGHQCALLEDIRNLLQHPLTRSAGDAGVTSPLTPPPAERPTR